MRAGLIRTGAIISACGVIMAGTFGAMAFGELAGMVQLGVALAAGVLLDTFVVRPILVPAYLTLLSDGRLGRCGQAARRRRNSRKQVLTDLTYVH